MKTQMAIKADFEIELPALPNFIRQPSGVTIDIKDIHAASLVEIADKWKEALLLHAEERRRNIPRLES